MSEICSKLTMKTTKRRHLFLTLKKRRVGKILLVVQEIFFMKTVVTNYNSDKFSYKFQKFLCNNKHAIKRTYDAISLSFFIFIHHIIYS